MLIGLNQGSAGGAYDTATKVSPHFDWVLAAIQADNEKYDTDYDEFYSYDDNCPAVYNPDQEDIDSDSIGDVCDNCPRYPNSDQFDFDGDGIGDACDNCPDLNIPDQTNSDWDEYGDLCDNCDYEQNDDQIDSDRDGYGDACDTCINIPNPDQSDADDDGIGDVCDNCPDVAGLDQGDWDNDGIGDICDLEPIPRFSMTDYGKGSTSPTPDMMRVSYQLQGGADEQEHNVELRWCDCSEVAWGGTVQDCQEKNCSEKNPLDRDVQFNHEGWHLISYNKSIVDMLEDLQTPVVLMSSLPAASIPDVIHVPGNCPHEMPEWSFVGHDDVSGLDTYHCDPKVRRYDVHGDDSAAWNWQQEMFWQYYLTLGDEYTGGFIDRSEMAEDINYISAYGDVHGGGELAHHWGRFWIRPEAQTSGIPEDVINDYASFHFGKEIAKEINIPILIKDLFPWEIYPDPGPFDILDLLDTELLSDDLVRKVTNANLGDIVKTSIGGAIVPDMVLFQMPRFEHIDSSLSKYLFDASSLTADSASSGLAIALIDGIDHRYVNAAYVKADGPGSVPDTKSFATVQFPFLVDAPDIYRPYMAVFGGEKKNGELSDSLWLGDLESEDDEGTPYVRFSLESKGDSVWPAARKNAVLLYHQADESLMLFGGELADNTSADDLWTYDIIEGAWHPCYANGGFLKGTDITAIQTPGSVFVSGASLGDDEGVIYRFSLDGRVPEVIADLEDGPGIRTHITMDLADMKPRKLVFFGGMDDAGDLHNDVWELNLDDSSWNQRMEDCVDETKICPVLSTRPTVLVDRDGTRITVYSNLTTDPNTYYQADDTFEGWTTDSVTERTTGGMECLFGAASASIADRAHITSPVRSNTMVEISADATVKGDVTAISNVTLRERAAVEGNVRATGSIVQQNNVTVAGEVDPNAYVETRTVPLKQVTFGTENVNVGSGSSCERVLLPGKYKDVNVSSNCTLMLTSGAYDMRKLLVNLDATLIVVGKVEVNTYEQFSFGDRAHVTIHGKTSDFVVYTNQTSQVYVGVNAEFNGYIEAPHAKVDVAPFSDFKGCIHASEIRIEADATVEGCNLRPVVLVAPECNADSDCETDEVCESNECISASASTIAASLAVDSNWDTGYCATVTVTNNGTAAVSAWTVVLDAHDSEVINLWNGSYTEDGSEYTVTPASWNGTIQAGASQSFGFCADKTGANYFPEVIETGGQ